MRCGSCEKLMADRKESQVALGTPKSLGPISNMRVRRECAENRQVARDFHFCATPTVTAGFIAFSFNIRK
jgi:hypothetical protein